jgi:hypothetical protein
MGEKMREIAGKSHDRKELPNLSERKRKTTSRQHKNANVIASRSVNIDTVYCDVRE